MLVKKFAVFHSNYNFVKNFRSLVGTFDNELLAQQYIRDHYKEELKNAGWFYELNIVWANE